MVLVLFVQLMQDEETAPWAELKRGGDFFLPSWLKLKFQVSSSQQHRKKAECKHLLCTSKLLAGAVRSLVVAQRLTAFFN